MDIQIILVIIGIIIAIIFGCFQVIVPFVKGEVKISKSWPFVVKATVSQNIQTGEPNTKEQQQQDILVNGPLSAIGYSVGRFRANVYLDLLGGGDQAFDRQSLNFDYQHEWMLLPNPIQEKREPWIKEEENEAKIKGSAFFNGPAVRLHSFQINVFQSSGGDERKRPLLQFRPTCWYDYVVSNRRIDMEVFVPEKGFTTIRAEYADERTLIITRRIDWVQLSNILTVSVVFVTKDRWTLLGLRTNLVDNARKVFTASAAENIHRWKDEPSILGDPWSVPKWLAQPEEKCKVDWAYEPKMCPNPFFTVLRAVDEEIAKEVAQAVTVDNVEFLSLAWDLHSFHPHLYAIVRVEMPITEVERIVKGSRAADSWEATLFPVRFEPGDKLKKYLADASWAEISKGAILRALVYEYGYNDVDKAFR